MLDVFKVRRSADSDDVLKKLNAQMVEVVDLSSATTLEDVDSGKVFAVDASTGFVITLPVAQKGLWYRFIITKAGTDGNMAWVTSDAGATSDTVQYMFGGLSINSTVATKSAAQVVTIANAGPAGTESNFDTLTIENDTTDECAAEGSVIEIIGVSETAWFVNGRLVSTLDDPASSAYIAASAANG